MLSLEKSGCKSRIHTHIWYNSGVVQYIFSKANSATEQPLLKGVLSTRNIVSMLLSNY